MKKESGLKIINYFDATGRRILFMAVKLDGKLTGKIGKYEGGYRYKPTGRDAGDLFKTIAECVKSLGAAQ